MELKNKLTSNCMKEVWIFYPAWRGKLCTSSQRYLVNWLCSHVRC